MCCELAGETVAAVARLRCSRRFQRQSSLPAQVTAQIMSAAAAATSVSVSPFLEATFSRVQSAFPAVPVPALKEFLELYCHCQVIDPAVLAERHFARRFAATGRDLMAQAEAQLLELVKANEGFTEGTGSSAVTVAGKGLAAFKADFLSGAAAVPSRVDAFLDLLSGCQEALDDEEAERRAARAAKVPRFALPDAAGSPGLHARTMADAFLEANIAQSGDQQATFSRRAPDVCKSKTEPMLALLYDVARTGFVQKPYVSEQKVSARMMSLALAWLGYEKEPLGVPLYEKSPFYKIEGPNGLAYIQQASSANISVLFGSLMAFLHALEAAAMHVVPQARHVPADCASASPTLSHGEAFAAVVDTATLLFLGQQSVPLHSAWKLCTAVQNVISQKFSLASGRGDRSFDTVIWPAVLGLMTHMQQSVAFDLTDPKAAASGVPPAKVPTPKTEPKVPVAAGAALAAVPGAATPGSGGAIAPIPTVFNGVTYPTRAAAKRAAAAAGQRLPKAGAGAAPARPPSGAPRPAAGAYSPVPPPAAYPPQSYSPAYSPAPPPFSPAAFYSPPPPPYGGASYYPAAPAARVPAAPFVATPVAPPAGAPVAPPGVSVCYDHTKGRCTRGAACKFAHVP